MKLSQRFTTFAAAAIAAIALMTTAAAAGGTSDYGSKQNYCDGEYKQVTAYSDYTNYSHIHLDVACPYDYRAISCEFDIGGHDDADQNKYFVAMNDASPYHFDSSHSDYKFENEYGCHFRANNFLAYFPGHYDFYWNLKGTATCVPTDCVHVDETHDYYDDFYSVDFDQYQYPSHK